MHIETVLSRSAPSTTRGDWLNCAKFVINILIANTSGFIISLIFNYLASMKYVFAHKEGMSRRREFIIFVVLSVIGLALNDGIVLTLNAGLGLEANIAKICATALVMVYNFVTRKIFLEGDETK